jgi:hypothetical protein
MACQAGVASRVRCGERTREIALETRAVATGRMRIKELRPGLSGRAKDCAHQMCDVAICGIKSDCMMGNRCFAR